MVHVIESSRVGGIHAGGSCVGSDEGESGGRRCASATNFRSEDGINLHKIALVTNVGNTPKPDRSTTCVTRKPLDGESCSIKYPANFISKVDFLRGCEVLLDAARILIGVLESTPSADFQFELGSRTIHDRNTSSLGLIGQKPFSRTQVTPSPKS